jgi:hypothetical protein
MLVTVGAIQSNHTRQTAAAAARHNLKCSLLHFGWAKDAGPMYRRTGHILLSSLMGADLYLDETHDRSTGSSSTQAGLLAGSPKSGQPLGFPPKTSRSSPPIAATTGKPNPRPPRSSEGIVADSVYEAKALRGLEKPIGDGRFHPAAKVLIPHLGGTPVIHAYADQFGAPAFKPLPGAHAVLRRIGR